MVDMSNVKLVGRVMFHACLTQRRCGGLLRLTPEQKSQNWAEDFRTRIFASFLLRKFFISIFLLVFFYHFFNDMTKTRSIS